jgi:hypothetical protein
MAKGGKITQFLNITATFCSGGRHPDKPNPSCQNGSTDTQADGWSYIAFDGPRMCKSGWRCAECAAELGVPRRRRVPMMPDAYEAQEVP